MTLNFVNRFIDFQILDYLLLVCLTLLLFWFHHLCLRVLPGRCVVLFLSGDFVYIRSFSDTDCWLSLCSFLFFSFSFRFLFTFLSFLVMLLAFSMIILLLSVHYPCVFLCYNHHQQSNQPSKSELFWSCGED